MYFVFRYLLFLLLICSNIAISQINEKYHKFPTIKFCHSYSEWSFEEYRPWFLYDEFNKFNLYSSYPNNRINKHVIGLGNSVTNNFQLTGDSAYIIDINGNRELFFVLNRRFYGDSIYVKSIGVMKNSYLKLYKIYFDLELNDSLFHFCVQTLDDKDTLGEGEVSSGFKTKYRINEFIFSKKNGFYMITYHCLNYDKLFTEYYYPESCDKIKKRRKKRFKNIVRVRKIKNKEKRSKIGYKIHKREINRLQE